ncbi:MAG: AAC(3) family N-acetyltransferase [Planctomycetota bacterium]|jgi:aminoglycoside N3'-acetyltransferase|nr:AAC(3) family N-acetyltransferase [Planctomycetota bacterium]
MPPVTFDDILTGLRSLGIDCGDVAFVHSSLSSFGYVEGGAETVVRALLGALGPDGTLVAPTFADYFGGQVWNRQETPSKMGRISETIRTWPDAARSPHAVHPVSAIGSQAEDITERFNVTDYAFDSPFSRLLERNAWIILIGVDFNSCTMIHLLEERMQVPYRHWVDLKGCVVDAGEEAVKTFRFFRRAKGVSCDFNPFGRALEQDGLVHKATIGQSTVLCFRSRDMYDAGMKALRRHPFHFVSSQTLDEALKHRRPSHESL